MGSFLSAIQVLVLGLSPGQAIPPAPVEFVPGTTRVLCQMTGDFDTALLKPTLSRTQTRASVIGTDLGISFEHEGRLCVLFGDTQGGVRPDADSFAWSDATDPQQLVLDFPVDSQGRFLPITIPGVQQGTMCVPSGGLSLGGHLYIAYGTDWYNASGGIDPSGNLERSVLARSDDQGRTWHVVYEWARAKNHDMDAARFINVCMRKIAAGTCKDLPCADADAVLLWGSGAYRKSDLYLACVPTAQIETRDAIRYFAGLNNNGQPTWDADPDAAAPLFFDSTFGELSVSWIGPIGRWVVLYNAGLQGIRLRMAEYPWGPFTEPVTILDRDFLSEQGWAAAYGPYLIERFTAGDPNRCTLTYTVSAWNPYQTFLVQSDLGRPLARPARIRATALLPATLGWHTRSQETFKSFEVRGCPYVTTFGKEGDAATGLTWTRLPEDANNLRLDLRVHGGHAEVLLVQGPEDIPLQGDLSVLYAQIRAGTYGPVLHRTHGRDSNETEVTVSWTLAGYRDQRLKVVVIDWLTEPWGFVSVSQMQLIQVRD